MSLSDRPALKTYIDGVRAGDRGLLSRAITLVESRRADDRERALALLDALLPYTGGAHRIGLSGVPGAGKSTLVNALGRMLVEQGHRLAVLAVDPSSPLSGGAVLADKTRMPDLAHHPRAYIRPTPSGGDLGGVARTTRETLLLCEAAGFDVVLVETVGVGQSEALVAGMVDSFLLLALPGAGDELQGIKKGVLELADVIAVNKADGPMAPAAREAARQLEAALRLLGGGEEGWQVPVLLISAREGLGLDRLWQILREHRAYLERSGQLAERRRAQRQAWFQDLLRAELLDWLEAEESRRQLVRRFEERVRQGQMHPSRAVRELLARLLPDPSG